ncbi:MAG TPA: hypothetical protein VI485_23120 [Vicinamibacterales bacterium]|nr:hypothetical protein [Vicinamibacterales bacterium]
MSDQNTDVVTTATKPAKRKSVSLTAGAGEKLMRLTILARRTGGDGGETTVSTTDVKKKATRGMTQKFDTFELAVEALTKLVKDAVAKGWKKTERAGGFKARPDAFTTMPAAPKAAGGK